MTSILSLRALVSTQVNNSANHPPSEVVQFISPAPREGLLVSSVFNKRDKDMNPESNIIRPKLSQHARFRFDEIRNEHQIVYPEGVLVLNESGASIVRRCDGRTTGELIADLQQEVSNDGLAADVHTFLARLAEKGLLCDAAQ